MFWLSCDSLPSLQEQLHIHGPLDSTQRLPNTLSISIRGLQSAQLLDDLSSSLAASAGAACHSGQQASMSHVLEAMQVCRRACAPWVAESGPAPCMPAQTRVLHPCHLGEPHDWEPMTWRQYRPAASAPCAWSPLVRTLAPACFSMLCRLL